MADQKDSRPAPRMDDATLRDYFAAMALQGVLAAYGGRDLTLPAPAVAARMACEYGDAMLAERAKKGR